MGRSIMVSNGGDGQGVQKAGLLTALDAADHESGRGEVVPSSSSCSFSRLVVCYLQSRWHALQGGVLLFSPPWWNGQEGKRRVRSVILR